MHRHSPERGNSRAVWWGWYLVLVALALVPWWRNHHYLRSFFDYGIAIGGIGRINQGQQPYVDFITPIQAGWYYLNRIPEVFGGGTYQAMTLSGLGCTVLATGGLFMMLARRWTATAAALVTASLIFSTVSQHTILWYNPWGVALLCVVVWAGAVAPVLRRRDVCWNTLALVALFFGGINKINMQLMALAFAMAWAVRAGFNRVSTWRRVFATIGLYFAVASLAVFAEMWWTGASLETWWHNVIALPALRRSSTVLAAFSTDFLIKPIYDYYGPLWLKPIGIVGILATTTTVVAILRKTWKEAGWLEKVLPLLCGLIAILGGMVLLMTNIDIAYIGLAGWLGLLVGLWLGYDLPDRGTWFYGGLVLPIVLLGAVAWQSAWVGQRSQFGHSQASRSEYMQGGEIDPDFHYLKDTLVPPEMAESLAIMANWRRALSPERRQRILYGPGTEMAAHFWPAMNTPGLPLYLQAGDGVGPREAALLRHWILSDATSEIMVSRVLDLWAGLERTLLDNRFDKHRLGGVFSVYGKVPESGVSINPVRYTRVFGGNADSRFLVSEAQFIPLAEGRMILGVTSGTGRMLLDVPTNRVHGDVVLRRVSDFDQGPMTAEFHIYAKGEGTTRYERWQHVVQLKAGQREISVRYAIDSSHLPTDFEVSIPVEFSGKVAAGWRGPEISHTGSHGPEKPNWFFRSEAPSQALDAAGLDRLLPSGWRPQEAYLRKGRVTPAGIELSPGGEIWLRVQDDALIKLTGTATLVGNQTGDAQYLPIVRGLWYQGGRLENFTDHQVSGKDRTASFYTWCAEFGGWLIIGVDPSSTASAATVRVNQISTP